MSTCSWLTSWYSSTSTASNSPASRRPSTSSRTRGAPVEQQVVEVEQGPGPLAGHVRLDHGGDRLDQVGGPGRGLGERLRQGPAGVHRAGVEVEQQALARGAPAGPGQPLLLADEVEQVGGVGRVDHREVPRAGRARRRWRRRSGGATEWNVPPHGLCRRSAEFPAARPSISAAARRVKVSSSTRCAGTPRSSSRPTRAVSVVVFPVPAPASTSSGPPSCSTASRCSSFSSNTRSTLPPDQLSVGAPLRESR